VVAGGIAALLLIGSGIWFQISCLGRLAEADHTRGLPKRAWEIIIILVPTFTKPGSPARRRSWTLSRTKSAAAPWPRSPEGELFVRRIGDLTVIDIPLCYEAGDMNARVAFDADERVASIFIRNPRTP